jgi:MazG family protein
MPADAPPPSGRLPAPVSASTAPADEFARLVEIMRLLRSPEGCPWDRRQTLTTLAPFVLEEAHEVVEAIELGEPTAVCDEVGDLLFECVFLAEVASSDGQFTIADAARTVSDKLVRRHPHVFTTTERTPDLHTPEAVIAQWHAIKQRERADAGKTARATFEGIPRTLPALSAAVEISKRAARVGFDWPDAAAVVEKIHEELAELADARGKDTPGPAFEELGDLLFAAANLARKMGVDPEASLRSANRKFTARFTAMEQHADSEGHPLQGRSLEELESLWQRVKQQP